MDPAPSQRRPRMSQTPPPADPEIAASLLTLARSRAEDASFCPSEAARALRPEGWRALLPEVRRVAARLQRDGLIAVTQGGRTVDAARARGPIRLSRPRH